MASIKDNTLTSVKEGSIVNFKAIAQTPLKSLRVNFTPIQQGEGDPSPENIRAIKGWTGLNVFHCGKNLSPLNSGNDIFEKGENIGGAYYGCYLNGLPNNQNFTLQATWTKQWETLSNRRLYLIGTSSTTMIRPVTEDNNPPTTKSLSTQPSADGQLILQAYKSGTNGLGETEYRNSLINIQIELGSVATEYEPYNGTTIPVSWDSVGTVYGGYVDVTNGKVQKTLHNIDLGTLNWTVYETGSNVYWANIPLPTINGNNGTPVKLYCSALLAETLTKTIGYITNSMPVNNITIRAGVTGRIYIKSDAGSASAVKESLNGVIAVYELATPIEYDLDPITIKTLIGTNNIWSNADSVCVEYYNLESLNLYKQKFKANQPYLQTANGSVASFQTALKAPLKECKVYFEPVQAEGTPSPDNVLPISGWTGFDLYKTSKNIRNWTITDTTIPLDYGGGEGNFNGFGNTYWDNYWIIPKSLCGKTITYSAEIVRAESPTNEYAEVRCWAYTSSGTYIQLFTPPSSRRYKTGSGRSTLTFTIPENTGRLGLGILAGRGDRFYNPIVSIGSTAVEYEPYNGSTTSITFPTSAETVYGGYVDLNRGVVVETMAKIILDGSINPGIFPWQSETIDKDTGKTLVHALYRKRDTVDNMHSRYGEALSDRLVWNPAAVSVAHRNIVGFFMYDGDSYSAAITLPKEDVGTTVAELNAYLQENPITIICTLATPVEYDIDIFTIKTLKGINNIWSNANGNTQMKYWTHGSLAKRKTLTWNQWVVKPSNNTWIGSQSNFNVTYNDDNIEIEFLTADAANYAMSIRQNVNNIITTYANHIYYGVCHIYPSYRGRFSMTLPGGTVPRIYYEAKQWSKMSGTASRNTDDNFYTYLPYPEKDMQIGDTVLIKAPMLIDLTQMFGAGNQPTKEEFESLCARNGIDLTQYQPYDEGSTVNWYV